LWLRRDELE
jgi:FtsZ-binding cell division protein ZapB